MSEASRLFEFNYLVLKILEGQAAPEEIEPFNKLLQQNPQALKDYRETIDMYVDMTQYGGVYWNSKMAGLQQMADYERTAPTMTIAKSEIEPQDKIVQSVIYPVTTRKSNRFPLVTAIALAAALFAVITFIHVIPVNRVIEVGTLSEGIKPQFAGDESLALGSRFSTQKEIYRLQNGIIGITFDQGAQVVIEAPAEFQFESAQRMAIHSGRVYATVPGQAKGFTINTPTATVIDLGTEFGVQVDADTSCVHMVKGRATLTPGPKKQTGEFQILNPNQARSTNRQGQVRTIPFEKYLFARRIDTKTGLVWKGHSTADLASLVAGGNGLAPVEGMCSIDPLTGKKGAVRGKSRNSNQTYNPSEANPYIDGLFIPVGGNIIISSAGHTFQCPQTEGHFTQNILVFYGKDAAEKENRQSTIAGNSKYGIQDTPYILMHSNIGITMDLARIKQDMGIVDPETCSFKTAAGMSMMHDSKTAHVNFYILVDGVIQFEKTGISPTEELIEIEVPLNTQGRFLSLIVTDCMEKNPLKGYACSTDFFYLIGPTLNWQL